MRLEDKGDPPFGYVLVTTNPYTRGGGLGIAYKLVRARLATARWPLFEKTRCRERITEGTRVAFYVAGKREMSGRIVATAVVEGSSRFRPGSTSVDPPLFVTDVPHTVLELGEIRYLDPPSDVRELMPILSIRPPDLRNWGSVLQGGIRSLNEHDWKLLTRS